MQFANFFSVLYCIASKVSAPSLTGEANACTTGFAFRLLRGVRGSSDRGRRDLSARRHDSDDEFQEVNGGNR